MSLLVGWAYSSKRVPHSHENGGYDGISGIVRFSYIPPRTRPGARARPLLCYTGRRTGATSANANSDLWHRARGCP
jgi:hypothetical protein